MPELAIVSAAQRLILSSPLLISIAVFAARWMILAFAPLAVFCLVQGKRGKHAVVEAVLALLVALLATSLIASVVQRPRPFNAPTDPSAPIIRLIPPPYNTSFPSGHTASASAMAAALLYVNRRVGFFAVAATALVALGRILVGVHYPTDIIGGLVVGIVSFMIVRIFHRLIRRADIERSARHHHHPA
ncbi:MAG: phosphatase PAP2 family protein [Patescibacteria group bacterium]